MGPLVSRAIAHSRACFARSRLSACERRGSVGACPTGWCTRASACRRQSLPQSLPRLPHHLPSPAAGLHLSQPLPARRGSGGVGPHPVDRGARPMRVECPDGAGEAVPPRALLRRDARLPPRGVTAARALREECCRRGALARSWAAAPVASFCRTRFERWMCGDAGLLCATPGRVPDKRGVTKGPIHRCTMVRT